MQWTVHQRHTAYESPWVNVYLDDVELPDGRHIEHHVLNMTRPSVGTLVLDDHDNTLLIWRHRFITNTWGWEVPAGWADPGEDPADAARREVLEETGWTIGRLEPMTEYNPLSGISDMHYTTYIGTRPRYVGPPSDANETSKVEWIPLRDVPHLAARGEVPDGPSLLMLSYYLAIHQNSGRAK
jgi:8-oxo-dGTP pyrophosphatase MutT (NUDIX family)